MPSSLLPVSLRHAHMLNNVLRDHVSSHNVKSKIGIEQSHGFQGDSRVIDKIS